MKTRTLSALLILALFSAATVLQSCRFVSVGPPSASDAPDMAPVAVVGQDTHVRQWLLLGPFPNPALDEPLDGDVTRAGYAHDYLVDLGGEAGAVLTEKTTVAYKDENGEDQTAQAGKTESESNIVDLDAFFAKADKKVAYAFAHIWSKNAQTVECFFGSDDWAKVWLNGEQVYAEFRDEGRGVTPGEERFSLNLNKGMNDVLVKVEEDKGGWGFVFDITDAKGRATTLAKEKRRQAIIRMQEAMVEPRGRYAYVFEPGDFPELKWNDPEAVEAIWGETPMTVRWFDAELNEVDRAEKPGRYAAYIECDAPGGRKIRRAFTFFCTKSRISPWRNPPKPKIDYVATSEIDKEVWEENEDYISNLAGRKFIEMLADDSAGPVLLAGLAEAEPLGRKPTQLEGPDIRDLDYHIALKRKILEAENKYPALKPLRRSNSHAPFLHPGTPEEAGMKADTAERLRAVCRAWNEDDELPSAALVARNGVIVFHEAFGEVDGAPTALDQRFPTASIAKTFAGLLLAQFLDQGILAEDDPVGLYLPDFPTRGRQTVTLRHCMTHTTGLDTHGSWGGLFNPWLDNAIANGLENMAPGRSLVYNGMGLDLAGKVMEIVSGANALRLMHERFFAPLGMDPRTTIRDFGFGIDIAVEDLARAGQVMANRGAYGDTEFFSPETFERLLPQPYREMFPDLPEGALLWGNAAEYGLGISWMTQPRPDAGKNGVPKDATVLSKNTIGHGSAASTVLRVDLDNSIVVAIGRMRYGKNYDQHLLEFLQAVEAGLE